MRRIGAAVAALGLAAVGGCSSSASEEPGPAGAVVLAGTVERVIDGDTLVARAGGERVRVRLLGVDAPETPGGRSPSECYGVEADDAARDLLPRGARIVMSTDPTQGRDDRFGRLLAEVTVAGELGTVNEALVAAGAAEVFRGDGRARSLPALRAAEERARSRGLGLWSACER